jgi:hypothetical protein
MEMAILWFYKSISVETNLLKKILYSVSYLSKCIMRRIDSTYMGI